MYPKNSDVFVALGVVMLNVLWMLLPYHIFGVGVVLALPMVFFVPGYMLIEILAHKRGLSVIYRLTLSLGLSLALDILGGFLLNMLPIGLRTQSWVVLLSCLTLVFALTLVYLRKDSVQVVVQADRRYLSYAPRSMIRFSLRATTVLSLAFALVVLSLFYATRGVAEQPHPSFTQLWLLPPSQEGKNCTVRIGIRSFENASVHYHAIMIVNSVQTTSWPAIALAPDELWERSVVVPYTPAKSVLVELRLYRDDKPTSVYRKVNVTLINLNHEQKVLHCGT